jgi:hypothetical protein
MQTVFDNGVLVNTITFEQVRENVIANQHHYEEDTVFY